MKQSRRLASVLLSVVTVSVVTATVLTATSHLARPARAEVVQPPVTEDTGLVGLPTDDPAATRRYIAGLRFVATPRVSRMNCHGNVTTTIDIYPEERSHLLAPAHVMERPRIVALIRNTGRGVCRDLHLAPGATAYWWMGPHRGLPLTTDFWSIPATGKIHHLSQTARTVPRRDGQYPAPDATISLTRKHDPRRDSLELVLFAHNNTWIACLGGCCESTNLVEAFY